MLADRKRRRLDSDMSSKSGVSVTTQMSELSDDSRQGNSVASGLTVTSSGLNLESLTELKTVNEITPTFQVGNTQRQNSERPWNEARRTRSDEKLKNRVKFTTGNEDENEATQGKIPRPPHARRMRRATESELPSFIPEEVPQNYDNKTHALQHVRCNRNRNRMHPSIAASGAASFDCLSEIMPHEEQCTSLLSSNMYHSLTVPSFPPVTHTSDVEMHSNQSSPSYTPPRLPYDGYLNVTSNSRCCRVPKIKVVIVMNVILILINIIGLPFLYYSMTIGQLGSETGEVRAVSAPPPCYPCEEFKNVLLIKYELLESFTADDGTCCIDSMEKLTKVLKSAVVEYDKTLRDKFIEVRGKDYRAEKPGGRPEIKRVVWNLDESVTKSTPSRSNDLSYYSIPRAGYYFIYTRVYFTRGPDAKPGQTVSVDYSLKVRGQSSSTTSKVVHEVSETWLPSNSTTKHSISAESIRHLQANQELFIEIPKSSHAYINSDNFHKMGIIFLST